MKQKPQHNKHIILADDNPNHCILFEKIVRKVDKECRFTYVYNGHDLLQLLEERPADFFSWICRCPVKMAMETINAWPVVVA